MIGMQSSLDRILSAIQSQNQAMVHAQQPPYPQQGSSRDSPNMPGLLAFIPPLHRNRLISRRAPSAQPDIPPAPRVCPSGASCPHTIYLQSLMFPKPHKYATYGIVPSTAPSSDDESEDTLPRSTLNAPIEALQGLANAAAEAAAAPSASPPRQVASECVVSMRTL